MKIIVKRLAKYPNYLIYPDGRIFSISSNKFLSQSKSSGYHAVCIRNINGIAINIRVHVLVAKAYVKNKDPEKNKLVDHINGKKLYNDFTNLQWIDNKGNSSKSDVSKNHNTVVCKYSLDNEFIKEYHSMAEASKKTGTSDDMIHKCCRLKCKSASDGDDVRYIWKYKNAILQDAEPVGKVIDNMRKYIILDSGKIYFKASKKYLKDTTPNADGYIRINLTNDDGKKANYFMHRLVMEAYEGKSELQVNHINSERTDNRWDNLEYVTASENIIHSFKYGDKKHCKRAVYKINIDTLAKIKKYDSITEAAKKNNIHVASIRNVCAGVKHTNTAGGFIWKYASEKNVKA